MEAIKQIQTVENGEIRLQLPKHLWGQQVEIIVLSTAQPSTSTNQQKKSLLGALQHYAQPERIDQEQDAWQNAASKKHDPR